MPKFKFDLKHSVALRMSGEQGEVIGRAEFRASENQYYILYKSADGRQVCSWWDESDVVDNN